ncbi:MAG: class I SAM-dependent methyltransferase [Rhizomicrobium sp.]
MELLYLEETQAAAFDKEFHSPAEMNAKYARFEQLAAGRPLRILDIGGGNGRFVDKLLDRFPDAQATVLDVSSTLLAANKPHPRKTLVMASVDTLPGGLNGETFDVITMNWLLHHLVGPTHEKCTENCISLLDKCRALLTPNGNIVVAENMYDGFAGTNIPSWLIYGITRIKAPLFVSVSRRFFNTAGVGVCFRSRGSWRRLFRQANYATAHEDDGYIWKMTPVRRLSYALLGIQHVCHRHFYLRAQ